MNGVSCVLLVLFTAPAEPDPTALKQWLLWACHRMEAVRVVHFSRGSQSAANIR